FEAIRALIDQSQKNVTGTARLKLYKGNCAVVGRRSPCSLYSEAFATFEHDTVYNQRDAEGFIKLNALRLRMRKMAEEKQ
ncbi:MAG: argininosuccinate synthase, partial [Blastocatellia bacterium]